jgi:AraC-like DNA-binding protein
LSPARAEFALAVALKLARDCTGADITPLRVCFAHPAPDNTSEHQRFFHGRVRFGAGSSSMSLSAADAARPMRDADAALEGLSAAGSRTLWEIETGRVRWRNKHRVRRMLVEHLGQSVLTLDAVASACGQPADADPPSGRGAPSFRQILDEVRRDFARALLQDRSLNIGDIAFFLQYSEPAAFHRSFRRWTGRTPQAFREA